MYKKCFSIPQWKSDKINDSYKVIIRKKLIKNPKNKYYRLNGYTDLVIDENGFNFLLDNYPHLVKKLTEVDRDKLSRIEYWGDRKIDIKVKGKYEYFYHQNELIKKEKIGFKFLGLSEYGDQTFWDTSKQHIEYTLQFGGFFGNKSPNKLIRFTKKDLNKTFDKQYFENIKIGIGGIKYGRILSKEENKW